MRLCAYCEKPVVNNASHRCESAEAKNDPLMKPNGDLKSTWDNTKGIAKEKE